MFRVTADSMTASGPSRNEILQRHAISKGVPGDRPIRSKDRADRASAHTYLEKRSWSPAGLPSAEYLLICRGSTYRAISSHPREDHIVPWKSAFRSKALVGREARFVLAASGHVAGVINPPACNKRSHWLNDDLESDPQGWLDAAKEKPGTGGPIGIAG